MSDLLITFLTRIRNFKGPLLMDDVLNIIREVKDYTGNAVIFNTLEDHFSHMDREVFTIGEIVDETYKAERLAMVSR
jgi:hypothetical protein